METNELLLSIAQCPDLANARDNTSHPCAAVVRKQTGETCQVPEPWTGHIETAPILFIGSNPGNFTKSSISPEVAGAAPIPSTSLPAVFDRDAGYTHQQPNGGAQYGKVLGADGRAVISRHWVRFWSMVKNHAATPILQDRPVPGIDYAITEMVHCKSNSEAGVRNALSHCSRKWTPAIMEHSSAAIVVLLGDHARSAAAGLWRLDTSQSAQFDVPIAGRNRAVIILPHPNFRGKRKIMDYVSCVQLERLRALLRDNWRIVEANSNHPLLFDNGMELGYNCWSNACRDSIILTGLMGRKVRDTRTSPARLHRV